MFADRAAFHQWIDRLSTAENGRRVREDEDRFIDRSHYFAYVIEECVTTT